MAFLIGGANSAAVSAYDIDYSLRFDGSSSKLHRAVASAGNQKTWTFSGWIKRSNIGVAVNVFTAGADVDNRCHLDINASGTFQVEAKNSGTEVLKCEGGMTLRDPSAWYHIVWRVDTTDGVAANRSRVYINGDLVTFDSNAYPDQNTDMAVNDDVQHAISKRTWADENYFSGYMSELALIDGTSLAPTVFGETDEDSGIWKPKEFKDDVTFGTNGFYIYFLYSAIGNADEEAVGNIGADYSGEGNHYASLGIASIDRTTDTPTNNFCTLNPIHFRSTSENSGTFSEGNLKLTSGGSNENAFGSIAYPNSGKWYFEVKVTTIAGGAENFVGVADSMYANGSTAYQRVAWRSNNGIHMDNETNTTYPAAGNATWSAGDIIGVFYDADNGGDLYFEVNGTESGSAKTDLETNANMGTNTIMPFIQLHLVSNASEVNFGNPSYSISSGNADANGYGNFEYAPTYSSTNYYALCTKNLAEFG
jgi:hypothetical protein